MAKVCQVTGKKPSTGHNVSHSVRRTKRRFLPNLQETKVYNPLTGKFQTLKVSTRGIRNLIKNPKKWFAKITK